MASTCWTAIPVRNAAIIPLFLRLFLACGIAAAAAGLGCVKVSMTGGATGGKVGGAGAGSGGGGSGTSATGGNGAPGSATGGSNATPAGGSGGTMAPPLSGGGSGNPGTGGGVTPVGSGGAAMATDGGAADRICQQAELDWVPKIPTVYLLVDRSGSMFDCLSTPFPEASCPMPADTSWTKLKDATLAVVNSLQTEVRFGFAAFTGSNPAAGGTCPIIDKVAPNLGNGAAIAALYNTLPFQPNTSADGKKFETPARQALDMIGAALLADTAPGDKYILFVTDGQPDYCDDSNSLCAPDSVIGGLQALKTKGVTTIVIGLQSALNNLAPGILQAFANAGAGEPTLAPLPVSTDTFAFFDQCNPVAGWRADLVASAKPQVRGVTLGTYASVAGPTKPYTPDAANQAMLMNQLSQALSGVKSCVFDLGDIDGKSIKVNLMQLDQAKVMLMGAAVPLSDTNGWRMNSATQLELTGTACATWRMPNTTTIGFGFPCDIIIIE